MLREESDALHVTAPAPALYLWTGEGGAAAAAPRTPPAGRSPEAVAAMQRARGSVPADATQRMAERQRARGLPVHWTPLPGLSHGQTLGASLPLLLQALAGETLAAVLGALEKKGLIVRSVDERDKRRVLVTPTERGLSLGRRKKQNLINAISYTFEQIGERDAREFVRLMKRVYDILPPPPPMTLDDEQDV